MRRAAALNRKILKMNESPIFAKTEVFMKWLLEHTAKFPKHERFRLAKRIEDAMFDFHTGLLQAVDLKDPTYYLKRANVSLNQLRFYLRLALEMGYTSPNQFQYTAQHTVELGKLLGGWLNKYSKASTS